MANNVPPESRVVLPDGMKEFLEQKGRYIRHNGNKISYDGIIGNNPDELPDKYLQDPILVKHPEAYDFSNADEASRKAAKSEAQEALRWMFGPGRYDPVKRAYMIDTSSRPIRLRFRKDGKKSRSKAYAKQPDVYRLVGRFLYSVISGTRPILWGMNEALFMEEGYHGNVLSRLTEKILLQSPAYREGIVRASVHADFIKAHDVLKPDNRLVDGDLQTVLFDFNMMLGRGRFEGEQSHALLQEYIDRGDISGSWVVDVMIDEQEKILRRIRNKEAELFRFAHLADSLVGEEGRSLREHAVALGYPGLEAYLEERIEEYRLMS